ncbi:MAG TPA: PQQ-dependent sugar dehydrogenase [Actinomycetota bacterium]
MKTRWAAIAVAVIALAGCGEPYDTRADHHTIGKTSAASTAAVRSQTYRGGLDFPVDMAWVHGSKKVFFTEKSGRIRVLLGRKLVKRPCARLSVNDGGERGLLGIALDPAFDDNHRLYVYYTNASPLENRVARFVVRNNRCRNKKDIVTGLGASSGYHNGGQLEFIGRHLYVAVGEEHDPGLAQDTHSRLGKILRINGNGSIPRGNPFSSDNPESADPDPNPVWSYGHRNPFGLARRPGTKKLYETENGPSCDDEVNLIKKGRNYGWGENYQCGTSGVGDNPKGPLQRYSSVIVPTDPVWYEGRIKSLSGSLLMGDFNNGRLHELVLNSKGTRIKRDRTVFTADGGIVDVAKGPGGWVYYLTPSAIMRLTR